jgi:hypothetical protein
MAQMGFSVFGAGVNPISGGIFDLAFDIGVPLLYSGMTTGIGTSLFFSADNGGFSISNDLATGTGDSILSGLDGQTIELKIESSAFVGTSSPVKLTFTIFGSGTPTYSTTRVVNAMGVFLANMDSTTKLTAVDLTDPDNMNVFTNIMSR